MLYCSKICKNKKFRDTKQFYKKSKKIIDKLLQEGDIAYTPRLLCLLALPNDPIVTEFLLENLAHVPSDLNFARILQGNPNLKQIASRLVDKILSSRASYRSCSL